MYSTRFSRPISTGLCASQFWIVAMICDRKAPGSVGQAATNFAKSQSTGPESAKTAPEFAALGAESAESSRNLAAVRVRSAPFSSLLRPHGRWRECPERAKRVEGRHIGPAGDQSQDLTSSRAPTAASKLGRREVGTLPFRCARQPAVRSFSHSAGRTSCTRHPASLHSRKSNFAPAYPVEPLPPTFCPWPTPVFPGDSPVAVKNDISRVVSQHSFFDFA
jgi:hypothetical protein